MKGHQVGIILEGGGGGGGGDSIQFYSASRKYLAFRYVLEAEGSYTLSPMHS